MTDPRWPHLTARELSLFSNPTMRDLTEAVRTAGGNVPIRWTSGDRTPSDTVRVGGVAGGCHERNMAGDGVPLTDDRDAWIRRVQAAVANGSLKVGELIWYPFDNHFHVSLPRCGGANELLVKEGPETAFTSLVAFLSRGSAAVMFLPLLFALLIFLAVTVKG